MSKLSRLAGWADRWQRRIKTAVLPPAGLIVYHRGYRLPRNPLLDSRRAERILGYVVRQGCATRSMLRQAGSIGIDDLALVHDFGYLENVAQPENLIRIFGHDVVDIDAEELVSTQRRMVGGTVLAARLAVDESKPNTIFQLGGGLHHASRDRGGGFCLFNDIAVAVARLRKDGFEGRILVVDLDLHHGDGTRRVFAADDSVFTFSIHASSWDEEPAVASLDVELHTGVGDETYLRAVRAHLPTAFERARPELVFYVAGVDVAADDRQGAWRVSGDGILARDREVVGHASELPMVWTLAGGYGDEAWRHTARSMCWFLSGDDRPIASQSEKDLARSRRIARQLTRSELSEEEEEDILLTPEELMADLVGPTRRSKLLGYYTSTGIETALERYGVLPHIRQAGYPSPRVTLDPEYPTGQLVRIHAGTGMHELLVEMVLRESREFPPFRLLSVEWLLMQDPRRLPDPRRPLLPGQEHPGLGALKKLFLMLVMTAERLDFDGLQFCPSHYHVAAQARGILAFLHPEDAARFHAMEAALTGLPLAQATRVVHSGGLVDQHTGDVVEWKAAPMVLPISAKLKRAVEGREYQKKVEEHAEKLRMVRAEQL